MVRAVHLVASLTSRSITQQNTHLVQQSMRVLVSVPCSQISLDVSTPLHGQMGMFGLAAKANVSKPSGALSRLMRVQVHSWNGTRKRHAWTGSQGSRNHPRQRKADGQRQAHRGGQELMGKTLEIPPSPSPTLLFHAQNPGNIPSLHPKASGWMIHPAPSQ